MCKYYLVYKFSGYTRNATTQSLVEDWFTDILLHNLNPPRLCNGTHLVIKRIAGNVIEATILTGKFKGEIVLLPRIPIIPSESTIPFKRLQFPICLAFAMTINKSQAQTMFICGLDLENPCFSHGQLYGACSRIGIFYNGVRVMKRNEWLAQPPIGNINPLHTPVPRVVIAHTASEPCHTTPACMIEVRNIQMFHIEGKQWFDIGYNFLVGGDGVAYIGRGWDAEGAHTKTYNNISIGIAFVGTFVNSKPPDVQIAAARKLIEVGITYNKISKTYILNAHCQLLQTASPGYYLYEDMKTWGHLETGKTAFTCNNTFTNFTDGTQQLVRK